MMINTSSLIPMTDANQNFSKVVRLVEEQGAAVILKNNKPRYAVIDFSEYDRFQEYKRALAEKYAGDNMIDKNLKESQVLVK